MYNRWINLLEFYNILRTIDNNHEAASAVIEKVNDEEGVTEAYMNAENSSYESMNRASVRKGWINDESNILNKTDTSSNDDECFNDSTVYGDRVEEEEIIEIEDNGVVSSF